MTCEVMEIIQSDNIQSQTDTQIPLHYDHSCAMCSNDKKGSHEVSRPQFEKNYKHNYCCISSGRVRSSKSDFFSSYLGHLHF